MEIDHDCVGAELFCELDRGEPVLRTPDDRQFRLASDQRDQRFDERGIVVGEEDTDRAATGSLLTHEAGS